MDDSCHSSIDDLSVLDPEQFEELQQTTPAISILDRDGRVSVRILAADSDDDSEDDFSEYLWKSSPARLSPEISPVSTLKRPFVSTLSPSSSTSEFSPPSSISTLPLPPSSPFSPSRSNSAFSPSSTSTLSPPPSSLFSSSRSISVYSPSSSISTLPPPSISTLSLSSLLKSSRSPSTSSRSSGSTLSPPPNSPSLSPPAISGTVHVDSLSSDIDLNVKTRRGGKKRPLPESADEGWKAIISGTIKEEIRCKIQLQRIRDGKEELKVDFTPPETTISYDVVKRRHEIREKNKEYAKQSRERAKKERDRLEQVHHELIQRNKKLQQCTSKLREALLETSLGLIRHCRVCSVDHTINKVTTHAYNSVKVLEPSPVIKKLNQEVVKQSPTAKTASIVEEMSHDV